LVLAALAQTTVLHGLGVHGGVPSLVLLVVAWFSARAGAWRGALFGLAAGLLEDALAGWTGAAWMLATPLAAALVGRIGRTSFGDTIFVLVPLVGLASLLRTFAFWLALRALGRPFVVDDFTLHAALWSAVFNAAFALVLLVVFPRLRPLHVERR
jgi:rod shape-determining protein MreD